MVVPVAVVCRVAVTVVHVVHVVAVRHRHMPAALPVRMVVSGVRPVFQGCRHADHLRMFVPPRTTHGASGTPYYPCALRFHSRHAPAKAPNRRAGDALQFKLGIDHRISERASPPEPPCPLGDVLGWSGLTAPGSFGTTLFPGDHFYPVDREADVVADVAARLAHASASQPAAPSSSRL